MSVRGVLVCHRGAAAAYSAEWTYWDGVEEARQAEAELAQPCGPQCAGNHTIVSVDPAAPVRRGGRPRREDVKK